MPDAETNHDTYVRNHGELLSVLMGGERFGTHGDGRRTVGIRLERFVYNRRAHHTVGYEGEGGVRELLEHLRQFFDGQGAQVVDGCLVGFSGRVQVGSGERVDLDVSVGAGAQLACSVGPSAHVASLLEAIEVFDREVHVAAGELGRDYTLLAEGYNPTVSGPLDVSLVPETRYALMNAFLSQTGRYARDAMRCSCATEVTLDYGDEADAADSYRLAVALTPLTMFLTDNTRSFRGSDARHTPRMTRSLVWEEVDPKRCGVIPGTFDGRFTFETYVSWLEGLEPILFTDSLGTTTSTGSQTVGDVLRSRALSGSEIVRLYDMALPDVRLRGYIELRQADAMRPRYAAAYAAFLKGIFYNDESFSAARELVGRVSESDVERAKTALRLSGWNASVYGRPAADLVEKLLRISRAGLADPKERRILDELATLWDVRMVPADAFTAADVPPLSIREYLGI